MYNLIQKMTGVENVQAAQKYITGLDARRIAKQPELRYELLTLWFLVGGIIYVKL
jgi:hypothetical protein